MPHLLVLSLGGMTLPPSRYANILQSCERLEQLEVECDITYEEPGVVIAPITLPHLHYLRFSSRGADSMWDLILDLVRAPNLVTLDIDFTTVQHNLASISKLEVFVRVSHSTRKLNTLR